MAPRHLYRIAEVSSIERFAAGEVIVQQGALRLARCVCDSRRRLKYFPAIAEDLQLPPGRTMQQLTRWFPCFHPHRKHRNRWRSVLLGHVGPSGSVQSRSVAVGRNDPAGAGHSVCRVVLWRGVCVAVPPPPSPLSDHCPKILFAISGLRQGRIALCCQRCAVPRPPPSFRCLVPCVVCACFSALSKPSFTATALGLQPLRRAMTSAACASTKSSSARCWGKSR